MKKIILVIVLLAFNWVASAQPNLTGVWPIANPIAYIDFYDDGTLSVDTNSIWGQNYYQLLCSAAIYSDDTQLLFQSNGSRIVDKAGLTIENGDSIVDSKFYQYYGYSGTTITQGVIALPRDRNTWWVFNLSFSDSGWTNGTTFSPDRLYGTIVDITANGGAGKVTAKKIAVYKGIMGDCRLTACRHANGRDWWLVNHGWNNNVFNKWLVTPDSIYGPFRDSVGTLQKESDLYGMAQFNFEGSKYAIGSSNGLVNILDFDRCTGEFANLKTIDNYVEPPWSITPYISSVDGLCFSANSRYLYFSAFKYLTQYDTWADTIDSTRVLIAKYDTSYHNTEPFFTMALTPQNKIMISNFQGIGGTPYHIIEHPDSGGLACSFIKEAITIPGSFANNTLPNVVNLKLGKLVGSGCDTLHTDNGQQLMANREMQIQVFPNPASEVVFVEEHELKSKGTLEVFDSMGSRVYAYKVFDEATVINVKQWGDGLYFYSLKTKSKDYSGKIVVNH